MQLELRLQTSENKIRPRMFQKACKYVIQHRKMVNMSYQNQILHSSWLTSQNAPPSIGSVYKLPPLFAPFLFCDVIVDKVHQRSSDCSVILQLCINGTFDGDFNCMVQQIFFNPYTNTIQSTIDQYLWQSLANPPNYVDVCQCFCCQNYLKSQMYCLLLLYNNETYIRKYIQVNRRIKMRASVLYIQLAY